MLIEELKERVAGFQIGDELKLEALCDEWNAEFLNKDLAAAELESAEKDEEIARLEIENAELREAQTDIAAELKRVEEALRQAKADLAEANQMVRMLIEEGK